MMRCGLVNGFRKPPRRGVVKIIIIIMSHEHDDDNHGRGADNMFQLNLNMLQAEARTIFDCKRDEIRDDAVINHDHPISTVGSGISPLDAGILVSMPRVDMMNALALRTEVTR